MQGLPQSINTANPSAVPSQIATPYLHQLNSKLPLFASLEGTVSGVYKLEKVFSKARLFQVEMTRNDAQRRGQTDA